MKTHVSASGRLAAPAFSLIELLAVIAILGVLLALVVPAAGSLMRSSGMTNAGDQLLATLSQARQLAMARNRTVEVRLYKYSDPSLPSQPAGGQFRAIQLFLLETTPSGVTTNAAGRKVTVPAAAYIASHPSLSSLLAPTATSTVTGAALGQPVPPCGLDYTANTFRIYPDGSTSLPATAPLFLTIVPANAPDDATLPENYATIVLQPTTGKGQLYRP